MLSITSLFFLVNLVLKINFKFDKLRSKFQELRVLQFILKSVVKFLQFERY